MKSDIRFEIDLREPFAGGAEFGAAGSYERIAGRIHFTIDPDAADFAGIVDLALAERNNEGRVTYSTDFYILRPSDLARSNGALIYDVNNRGNMRLLQFVNDAVHSNQPSSLEHAGNGFLMRRGYSIVWSGWQGDLLEVDGRLTMRLPIPSHDGAPVTGPTRCEFVADSEGITSIPLSANSFTRSYAAVGQGGRLTMRAYEGDARIEIPATEWQFATLDASGEPVASDRNLYLPAGFKSGWIYELVYTARDPEILGLGFTGLRDMISFLLHEASDSAGVANPLRDGDVGLDRAYAWGRSQSGRFLREFVYQGFNVDSAGRQVFAGVSPHVSGGGRVWLNARFAQPGRFPRQHDDHLYPSDQFPFAYASTTDPHTGKTDGILKRPESDPLVIHTQTSSEYWDRHGSLVHTDIEGNDLEDPPGARIFLFASSQHNADPLLPGAEDYWQETVSGGFEPNATRYRTNPLNTSPLLRAIIDALDAWVVDGTEPPASRAPRAADGTLVTAAEAGQEFPTIDGVAHPDEPCRLHLLDFGEEFDRGIITREPPLESPAHEYTVRVPAVDDDGNERVGIRTPHVAAPLATYTGWNYRAPGSSGKALKGTVGSYFPLAPSNIPAAADGRAGVRERYGDTAGYVAAIEAAARELVEARLLLEEDYDRYVEAAATLRLD